MREGPFLIFGPSRYELRRFTTESELRELRAKWDGNS